MGDFKPTEDGDPIIWGPSPKTLILESEAEYEDVFRTFHKAVQTVLINYRYNTIDSFVQFYKDFSSLKKKVRLEDFLLTYPVKLEDRCMSCVGLALKIIKHFSELQPSLSGFPFYAICNEQTTEVPAPTHSNPPPYEIAKLYDHALVALQFSLRGRIGYLIGDMGLFFTFPVVVMRDGLPPQTGAFSHLARDGHREYTVEITHPSSDYMLIMHRTVRTSGKVTTRKYYTYIGRSYLYPEDLERRTLVDPFHAYVQLGTEGVRAGLVIILGKASESFTILATDENEKIISSVIPYDFFCNPPQGEAFEKANDVLKRFSVLCGFEGIQETLDRFRHLSETLSNTVFLQDLLSCNETIIQRLLKAGI